MGRGANVTDIVVRGGGGRGCKEQTVDSLACAKLAGAPVVVAVNKMDVEGADAQRVEGELMSYDLVPESAGGDTLVARVSAKEKTGLDELLEKVLLQADLLDLKANPDRPATGTLLRRASRRARVCARHAEKRGAWGQEVPTAGAAGENVELSRTSSPLWKRRGRARQCDSWAGRLAPTEARGAGDALSVVPDEPAGPEAGRLGTRMSSRTK